MWKRFMVFAVACAVAVGCQQAQEGEMTEGDTPTGVEAKLAQYEEVRLTTDLSQLTDAETRAFADSGAHIAHCPESNLKLASGFCPVQRLIDAGINVALGTDGAASNNDLDMLGEMKTAALLANAVHGDASALPAGSVLRMATLNGARALGLADETGSLEVGKWADITAVDLETLETSPLYNPVSQLVYAASREQVTDVWVAGQHVLKDRELTHLESRKLIHQALDWQERITAGESSS